MKRYRHRTFMHDTYIITKNTETEMHDAVTDNTTYSSRADKIVMSENEINKNIFQELLNLDFP